MTINVEFDPNGHNVNNVLFSTQLNRIVDYYFPNNDINFFGFYKDNGIRSGAYGSIYVAMNSQKKLSIGDLCRIDYVYSKMNGLEMTIHIVNKDDIGSTTWVHLLPLHFPNLQYKTVYKLIDEWVTENLAKMSLGLFKEEN